MNESRRIDPGPEDCAGPSAAAAEPAPVPPRVSRARPCRWHVTGASGAGVTTLGRALAQALSVPAMDTDDFFWLPTEPPYRDKRPIADRLALMEALFLPRRAWVLSGSLSGWGDPVIPRFEAVVFLTLDPALRLARLEAREALRHGAGAIRPGGTRAEGTAAFLDWARRYDDPAFTGRSRAMHENWLEGLPCPVLRLDSAEPVDTLVARCLDWRP